MLEDEADCAILLRVDHGKQRTLANTFGHSRQMPGRLPSLYPDNSTVFVPSDRLFLDISSDHTIRWSELNQVILAVNGLRCYRGPTAPTNLKSAVLSSSVGQHRVRPGNSSWTHEEGIDVPWRGRIVERVDDADCIPRDAVCSVILALIT